MLDKIVNAVLSGGLQKEEYELIHEDAMRINQTILKGLSSITAAYMLVMIALSFRNNISYANQMHFIWCLCACLFILMLVQIGALKNRVITLFAVYLYLGVIFAYGIAIGNTQASQTSVSFLIFIMVGPMLFYDRPIRMIGFIWIFDAVFIYLSMTTKSPLAGETDYINGVSYGIVSALVTTGSMSSKFKRVWLQQRLRAIAGVDILTNLKNRNSFERELQKYKTLARKKITCVYFDANGLHTINNLKGHKAGDQMLVFLAEQIVCLFGCEHAYRVGGDEFVVFVCDGDAEQINGKIDILNACLEERNYSVSTGIISAATTDLDMNLLVRNADAEMYHSKKNYYTQSQNDRRRKCEETEDNCRNGEGFGLRGMPIDD